MRVGLFIPCYIDQMYPQVGVATVELLEELGVSVEFPAEQTCCGQPMSNTGCTEDARPLAERMIRLFGDYDYVVCPSGSCVSMVRHHYQEFADSAPPAGRAGFERLKQRTFELCEFLVQVLGVERLPHPFPHRVGLHASCHGLRELRLDRCSELMGPAGEPGLVRGLLAKVEGLELVELKRPDECCGFGGTFAVFEEAVSVMMGQDRVADHLSAGATFLTATDMSCLMHLQGIILRKKLPLRVVHVAEILAGRVTT